jgi:hypothetical protein
MQHHLANAYAFVDRSAKRVPDIFATSFEYDFGGCEGSEQLACQASALSIQCSSADPPAFN